MASGKALAHFAYVSGVSLNSLTTSGVFYCDGCTDLPSGVVWLTWVTEVSSVGTNIKQLIRPFASDYGYCFERHYLSGAWSAWCEVGRTLHFQGNTATVQYVRKPGNASYGSFIITGTAAGDGGVLIGVTINGGVISSARNLMTNAAWSGNLTITYGVTNGVGYIGFQTTSSAGSNLCIVGG